MAAIDVLLLAIAAAHQEPNLQYKYVQSSFACLQIGALSIML